MRLTREVPAHVETLELRWLSRDFLVMSPAVRRTREKHKMAAITCQWCGHAFADGEMVALAAIPMAINATLCQACCASAEAADAAPLQQPTDGGPDEA